MAHSSWGSGWPNCQSGRIAKNFGVDTVQGRVNFPGGVRVEIQELVSRLVQETARRGYRFGVDGNPSYGCWGYNCRAIAGTRKPSNHSWGLAVDINAPRNPYTSPLKTDMPSWMPELWKQYGFRWGGNYGTVRKDAMHYEFLGSVVDCKTMIEKARQNHLGETPPPQPQPQPPDEEYAMDTLDLRNAHVTVVTGRHVDNMQSLLIATWQSIPDIHQFIGGMVNGYGLPDGLAGEQTAWALRVFQSHVGLEPDAICGPNTWKKLIEY